MAIGSVLTLLTLLAAWGVMRLHQAESFPSALNYRVDDLPKASAPSPTHYPIDALQRYTVTLATGDEYALHVARYHDAAQQEASAIVFVPEAGQAEAKRREAWQHAAQAIVQHTEPEDLFLAWWDNSQRIELFTGRRVWNKQPSAANWSDTEQAVWRELAGGFATDETAARQLAKWLAMPANEALADMARFFDKQRAVYLLVTADDLARWPEVARLTAPAPTFESQAFQSNHDWHGLIKQVRRWALSGATPSTYLLQPLEGLAVRAWRAVDPASAASLWAEALPFVSIDEQTKQEAPLTLVYQSPWAHYLSIYRLHARP